MRNKKRQALSACAVAAVLLVAWTTDAEAQRRGRGRRIGRSASVIRVNVGFGYRPFYYGAFYSPFYGPFGHYYGPPYPGGYYEPTGAVRVQVKPEATEVWVDGYFAGVADSFDGFFQRLRLPPGEYEVELRLNGYRSVRERVLVSPGVTFRIRHNMEPLRPGEVTPPPPEPVAPPAYPPDGQPYPPEQPEYPPAPPGRAAPPEQPTGRVVPSAPVASDFGTLALRVRPLDADVLIDGEPWQRPTGSDRLVVELGPGVHQLEIRKEGYRRFVTEIDIVPGEATVINVGLPPLEREGF